ncbi:ABC-type transport system, involved in lipoprotein release, permease component [Chryseolinea serpens]|uniref:ABC-type transport system, involved in lipoprotein release, permease component n=1 Tax=Chryseolinea serpens TaxID=947013 RepID=A0A1M5WUA8_9BACT|nr:ABC transporter permease [Chryseolinea serpens]SHH91235.1 ABC-type transport system, involved in lipoprotein release, permease component [Chryseolinea serpens]
MLKNYLKTSFRNLLRHKSYTFINVLGLTVGLVTSIFILLWIIDELSFDRFPSDADRIFKVMVNNAYPDGKIETYPATPAKLKDVIVQEIPEVELAAQYSMETELLVKFETTAYNAFGVYADPTLFQIFSFPVVSGNATKPLTDIKSIAVSERLAKKLFKNGDAIGKSINLAGSHDLIVTSVFADIPQYSTLQFDFVAPIELFTKENPWTQHWKSGGTQTTVLLKSSSFVDMANQKFVSLIKNNCPDCTTTPFLFPYVKSRLYNEFENGKNAGGRIQQIYLFGAVAVLILAMACINFTNLSTARAASRSREVGIRKAIGAQKNSLVVQFVSESILLSFIAVLFAMVIVQLLLPFFNEVTTKSIRLDVSNPVHMAGILAITLICGLLAGSYPAFVLSRFNPVKVLKGNTQLGLTGNTLRKSLVIVQFTASIILVVGSIAVYKQIVFISEKNLGFDKDNIIVVDQNEGIVKSYPAIKNDLYQSGAVKSIAFGGNNIFTIPITTTDPVWASKPDNSSILFKIFRCDAEFIPTINIKIQSGRNFIDGQDASNYIINRKAAEVMGLSFENAVGSELEMWNGKGKIIGITDDFHNDNLKFGIEPLIFMYSENVGSHYFMKLSGKLPFVENIEQIETIFKKHNPDHPFEYIFLDDVFKKEYQAETVIGKLFLSFTVVAVLISCLGLFGLASFTAERRTKELGIRKVMGASVGNLVVLLCSDFANLVLAGLCIGFPVSWYLIREYLSKYAFHAEINLDIYILTSIVMLLIVLLSVGYQSAKAAISNPVDSLRNE